MCSTGLSSTFKRLQYVLLASLVLAGCGGGGGGSDAVVTSTPFAVGGSVGDGPIVNAEMALLDSSGEVIATAVATDAADYQIDVPTGTVLPAKLVARGGTDLVTGRAAEFQLIGAVTSPGPQTVNVSPLTTLAVVGAECTGPLSDASLAHAWERIHGGLGMGLDRTAIENPMTESVNASNVATIVLANEALGEAIRRTHSALVGGGSDYTHDDIVRAVACDLADGRLDGRGVRAEARVSATFRAAEFAVLLEVIAGRLEVDGSDATARMDDAIRHIRPPSENTPSVVDVPISEALLRQVADSATVLQMSFDRRRLVEAAGLAYSVSVADARSLVDQFLTASASNEFFSLANEIALTDAGEIALLSDTLAGANQGSAPFVSLSAGAPVVAPGGDTTLSWASSEAAHCFAAGDWYGIRDLAGSINVGPLKSDQTYRLSCFGNGQWVVVAEVVRVSDNEDLLAGDPTSPTEPPVAGEGPANPPISAPIEGPPMVNPPIDGSPVVGPPAVEGPPDDGIADEVGNGGGFNDGGSSAPVVATLSASSTAVAKGEFVNLTWSSTQAEACTASGGWSGRLASNGTQRVGPILEKTTFNIECANSGQRSVAMVSISVLGELRIEWQAPATNEDGTPLDDLAGYNLYVGGSSGNYETPERLDAGTTATTLRLPPGQYFVAMTAFDLDGNESQLSNEVRREAR